jgi:hypothetical protein
MNPAFVRRLAVVAIQILSRYEALALSAAAPDCARVLRNSGLSSDISEGWRPAKDFLTSLGLS